MAGAIATAVILWFMLITCAATLGRDHVTVSSAAQAAAALRPLAGRGAADLFAVGLLTSAVVALPVLIATTAHVVGAQFDWRRGLSEGIGGAWGFYAALAASIGLAVVLALTDVSVIAMLQAASVRVHPRVQHRHLMTTVRQRTRPRIRELRGVRQPAARNRPVDVERPATRQPLAQRVQHVVLELRPRHRAELVELHQDRGPGVLHRLGDSPRHHSTPRRLVRDIDQLAQRHGLHLVQYPPAAQGAQRGGNRAEAARRRRVRQLFEHIRRASTQHHPGGDFLAVERLDVADRLPVLGRLDHLAFGRPLSRLQLDRDVPGQGFHRGGDHRHAGLGDNAELGLAAWILERLDPVDQPADRLALGHQHEHRDEEHGNRPGEIAGQQHGRFVHASSLAGSGAQLKTQPSNRSSDSGNAAEVQRLGEHSAVLERSGPAGGEGGG